MRVANRSGDRFAPMAEDLQLDVYRGVTRKVERKGRAYVAICNASCVLQRRWQSRPGSKLMKRSQGS